MKKLVLAAMVVIVFFVMGNALRTDNTTWVTLGECTGAALTTPAVGERDYANMVANHSTAVIWTATRPYSVNNIGLRFVVDDDADAWVVDVFATRGKGDYFTRIATLTLTGGTQIGPPTTTDTTSGVFCDTIAITNSNWITAITLVDNAAGNQMSTVWFDMNGYDTLAFIHTTAETSEVLLIQACYF